MAMDSKHPLPQLPRRERLLSAIALCCLVGRDFCLPSPCAACLADSPAATHPLGWYACVRNRRPIALTKRIAPGSGAGDTEASAPAATKAKAQAKDAKGEKEEGYVVLEPPSPRASAADRAADAADAMSMLDGPISPKKKKKKKKDKAKKDKEEGGADPKESVEQAGWLGSR